MFKLIILLFLQAILLSFNSVGPTLSILLVIVIFTAYRRPSFRPLLTGTMFFAAFVLSLLILQGIEHLVFREPFSAKPALLLGLRGLTSFCLFAVFSSFMTRLEVLSILERLHTPAFVITIIYMISYFLERLLIHSKGLKRSFVLRSSGLPWLSRLRLLLNTIQNFIIFALIRFREIPKVMELRDLPESLPIAEWRTRERLL
jgi:hypothetical protein